MTGFGIDSTAGLLLLIVGLAVASSVVTACIVYHAEKRVNKRRKLSGPGGPALPVVRTSATPL